MKKFALTSFKIFLFTIAFGQFKPTGTFVGLETIKDYSSSEYPNHTWYHLSVFTFNKDSVYLKQSPVAIYERDTIFSSSEGGFYYYKGTLQNYEGKTIADLELYRCDFCPKKVVRFTPPKLVRDDGTVSTNIKDTARKTIEIDAFENSKIKYRIMTIEKTTSNKTLLINKNIYKRQN